MKYPWLKDHWEFFLRRLAQQRLAHALMIEGPAGVGKNELAAMMVAHLLCNSATDSACGECMSCRLLVSGAHPDRFELIPEEGKDVIKVDQVRGLISSLNLTTSISDRKVAYIHPADGMNMAAANALLKSLEEPVGNAVLILVSNDSGRLPVTIRSRCQSIVVNQPDHDTVVKWLSDSSGSATAEVQVAVKAAGGSPLRAEKYLNSPQLDAYALVTAGLVTLMERPGAVSVVSSQLADVSADELWRWLSMCLADASKQLLTGESSGWMPAGKSLPLKALLGLQKQADINRRLSVSPVRGDLLLQDWLIRWAEISFE